MLSGENRTTVLLRDGPQSRIHTTLQRIASPNTDPRVPSATIYGPKSGSVRQIWLGHAVHYSTAPKELSIRPAAIPGHGGQIHDEEATDLGNGEYPLEEDAAMPEKRAYGGLGKSLVASPRKTLYRMFVKAGVLRLDTQFEFIKGVIICTIECQMLHNGEVVVDHGTGVSKVRGQSLTGALLSFKLTKSSG